MSNPKTNPKKINRIREVLAEREKAGQESTQLWLSKKAEIAYPALNNYYWGRMEPSLKTLRKVAEVLKVSIKDLVSDK